MLRDNPAKHDCSLGNSRKRVILELHSCVQSVMRIALAAGLLACFVLPGFCASPPPVSPGLTVKRSTRVFPHRFLVHPDGATVAANQTQRFEVTDAQGKTVAVHWNISGLTCSGLACGSIDSEGVYRTPSALSHPEVVILEGVLDSNPNYSVLTQIALVPTAASSESPGGVSSNNRSAAPAQVAVAKTQPMPSVAEQQNLRTTAAPPLPRAVAAAPVVERQITARASVSSQPQPEVTRPMPVIEASNVAPEHSLPPLPTAVTAAPNVDRQIAVRASVSPPTQNVTAPPPAIEAEHPGPGRSYSSSLPTAVAAAPVHSSPTPPPPATTPPVAEAKTAEASSRESLAMVSVPQSPASAVAAPAPKSQIGSRRQTAKSETISLDSVAPAASVMVKVPVNAAPASAAKTTPAKGSSPPQPKPAAVPPAVETQIVARAAAPQPPSNITVPPSSVPPPAASRPMPTQNAATAASLVEKQTIAYNTPVLPLRSPAAVASERATAQISIAKTQRHSPSAGKRHEPRRTVAIA